MVEIEKWRAIRVLNHSISPALPRSPSYSDDPRRREGVLSPPRGTHPVGDNEGMEGAWRLPSLRSPPTGRPQPINPPQGRRSNLLPSLRTGSASRRRDAFLELPPGDRVSHPPFGLLLGRSTEQRRGNVIHTHRSLSIWHEEREEEDAGLKEGRKGKEGKEEGVSS
jgi:hypothetical protein